MYLRKTYVHYTKQQNSSGSKSMKYLSKLESLRQHKVPQWYEDCKLGIFIHWGLYSVPAFAPLTGQLGDFELDENWFSNNPYAEWYYNSVKVGHGPSYEYHTKKYGRDFPYENFADMWKAENFDASEWAEIFHKAGAGYVVLTTKHHDGFCLWPSEYTDYNSQDKGPRRDIMGELTDAVRKEGMKMGAYYSGIIDWRYTKRPVTNGYESDYPDCVSYEYSDYAYNQVMELIDRYHPSVLWNDIGWPVKGRGDLPYLFSYYYNTVEDGLVNDRWVGGLDNLEERDNFWYDFSTKEYHVGAQNIEKKWEMTRGLGFSFAYNQMEDESIYIGRNELVRLLIDTVAHNGNLLINVGPKADGTLPEVQKGRLLYLGNWLEENGEAVYGTRIYKIQDTKAEGGQDICFTQKDNKVYLFVMQPDIGTNEIRIKNVFGEEVKIESVSGEKAHCDMDGDKITIHFEAKSDAPMVFRAETRTGL